MTTSAVSAPTRLDLEALHPLFAGAHTTYSFSQDAVDPALIQQAYEQARWAPTAMNSQPLRLSVLQPGSTRDAVVEHFAEGNQAKTLAAPLTVIASYAPDWHQHLEELAPHMEGMRENLDPAEATRHSIGEQSAMLQVGYLILTLRAQGLSVGPMNGFDAAGVDSVIHTENGWKTLVAINVGHAANPHDDDAVRPRAARLEFHQISQVL